MDDFFNEESLILFKKWIYFQLKNNPRLTFQENDHGFDIEYKNKKAHIEIWSMGIIEETITYKDQTLFYLHFQLRDYGFAMDMFERMINKLLEEEKNINRTVLLCCTGGMTTSFFAEKMNKYCELNRLSYHFQATAIYNLDSVHQDYELILLAPQLRYKILELTSMYKPTTLKTIDPETFATYDCQKLLETVEDFYEEKKHE